MRLGTAGIRGGWALQGYLMVGHCRHTLPLGAAGKESALQGYSAVGTVGTLGGGAGILCGGTAGTLGGWALQGCLVVGQAPGGGRGQH